MRRATKLRSSLVKRRSTIIARLDSYLELLGPAWHACFKADLVQNTPLQLLAAGYGDPHTLRRLGRARLSKLIWRHSLHRRERPHQDVIAAIEGVGFFHGENVVRFLHHA